MKQKRWKTYLLYILSAEAAGALAGFLTRAGTRAFQTVPKPALTPPGWVFAAVWAALYLLMGVGAARVSLSGAPRRREALGLYAIQLAFNFVWSLLFFNLQSYGFALLWLAALWILLLLTILAFARADRTAALLQLPYLLWSSFALYLCAGVWLLNR